MGLSREPVYCSALDDGLGNVLMMGSLVMAVPACPIARRETGRTLNPNVTRP